LYIGDSETDVKTAQNAGLPFIGVSWGFRTFEELKRAGAEVIVKNPEELVLKIIKKRGL
jgi:phosphoglycolate phosphatase